MQVDAKRKKQKETKTMIFNSKIWHETIALLNYNSNQGYMDMRELVHTLQISNFVRDHSPESAFAMGIEYQKTIQAQSTKGD